MKTKKLLKRLIIVLITLLTTFYSVPVAAEGENAAGQVQKTSALESLTSEKTADKTSTDNNINVYILESSDLGGSYTYRSFIYTVKDTDNNLTYYKGCLYGDGIDDDSCLTFAQAALNSSNKDQTITNNVFIDSNKSSIKKTDENGNISYDYNEGYDSNQCWIKSAADVLQLTGWMKYVDAGIFNTLDAYPYFEDEDDIADYLSYCFIDDGGYQSNIYDWIFTGNAYYDAYSSTESLKYDEDLNDALLNSYYLNDLYTTYLILSDDNNYYSAYRDIDFNRLETENGAVSLSIDFYKGEYKVDSNNVGAHAITLNGLIYKCDENNNGTIDYTLSQIIITDPDDSVRVGPENPKDKDKIYKICSVSIINDPDGDDIKYYNMNNYDSSYITVIEGSDYLKNSKEVVTNVNGDTKLITGYDESNNAILSDLSSSITPTSTRAIKDNYYTTGTTYDVADSLSIGLNYDFLYFYDINNIKYELKDNNGNTVKSGTFEYNKSTWKNLKDSNNDFSLDFTNIINEVGAGTYNLVLTIDKDCFYGNYGWFAEKSNYSDTLADITINMYHKPVVIDDSYDEEETVTKVTTTKEVNKVVNDSVKVVSPTETLIKNDDGTYNRKIVNEDNYNIQITSKSSLIPTGTTFSQELLNSDSKEYELIEKALNNDSLVNSDSISSYFAYNFDLTQDNGTEIHELDGYVEVSLPVPSSITIEENQHLTAYRVNDDGSLTKCDTEVIDGIIKFKTDHFSTYVFVVENDKTSLNNTTAIDNEVTTAEATTTTSINYTPYIISGVVVIAGIGCLVIVLRKKNKYEPK